MGLFSKKKGGSFFGNLLRHGARQITAPVKWIKGKKVVSDRGKKGFYAWTDKQNEKFIPMLGALTGAGVVKDLVGGSNESNSLLPDQSIDSLEMNQSNSKAELPMVPIIIGIGIFIMMKLKS